MLHVPSSFRMILMLCFPVVPRPHTVSRDFNRPIFHSVSQNFKGTSKNSNTNFNHTKNSPPSHILRKTKSHHQKQSTNHLPPYVQSRKPKPLIIPASLHTSRLKKKKNFSPTINQKRRRTTNCTPSLPPKYTAGGRRKMRNKSARKTVAAAQLSRRTRQIRPSRKPSPRARGKRAREPEREGGKKTRRRIARPLQHPDNYRAVDIPSACFELCAAKSETFAAWF